MLTLTHALLSCFSTKKALLIYRLPAKQSRITNKPYSNVTCKRLILSQMMISLLPCMILIWQIPLQMLVLAHSTLKCLKKMILWMMSWTYPWMNYTSDGKGTKEPSNLLLHLTLRHHLHQSLLDPVRCLPRLACQIMGEE